jgi:hypothetical protein
MSLRLPRGKAYDPYAHAAALEVQVLFRPLTRANEFWLEKSRTIFLKSGMREDNCRVALAHGLAHMILGHPDDRPKFEQAADRYCSLHLIHPVELGAAISAFPDDEARVAAELGVTRRVLRAYLEVRGVA